MMFAENPLDAAWDEYDHMSAMVEVGSAAAEAAPGLFAGTAFQLLPPDEVLAAVRELRDSLDELYIISMWACFEAWLRDYVQSKCEILKSALPQDVANDLYAILQKKADSWNTDDLFMIVRNCVDETDISLAKKIRTYRNWLSHGKNIRKNRPAASSPSDAYVVLHDIIRQIVNHEMTS